MSKMFEDHSRKVLPYRQNQCLKRKDYQFPIVEGRNHFRIEHFQDYVSDCPHHGMEEWMLMQGFYHGLI